MKNKIVLPGEAVSRIKDGDTLMVGGLYSLGEPQILIDEIIRQGIKDLTVINVVLGKPDSALGRLIYSGNVKKLIVSFCGYMTDLPELEKEGKLEIELNPEGTFAERVRAGGFGLGGVLTPTGLGTYIEEKGIGQRVTINGEDFLYHTPLNANVTLVQAYAADEAGNLVFHGTQKNVCDMMCFASRTVIASVATPIKRAGELDPDNIHVPGAFVDMLVQE